MIVNTIDNRIAEMQELEEVEKIEEEAGIKNSPAKIEGPENMAGSFMSESVYDKLNSPIARKRRAMRRLQVNKNSQKDEYQHRCYRNISLMERIFGYFDPIFNP